MAAAGGNWPPIVRESKAFLFDEPLSHPDGKLRAEKRTEIKRLRAQLRTTVVWATNDQVEAMALALKRHNLLYAAP